MMRYSVSALLACVAVFTSLRAADDAPGSVERTLALQTTLASARDFLAANKPAAAVDVLEKQLASADGNRAFLDLLRTAYDSELKLLASTNGDAKRMQELRTKLALLGSPVPATPAPKSETTPAPAPAKESGIDLLSQASALFTQGKSEPKKFDLAAQLYAAAFANKVEMNTDQLAAWAFCRVRVAGDRLNRGAVTGPAAAEVAREIEDALKLAPYNTGLQKVGTELMLLARQKAGANVGSIPAPTASVASTGANPFTGTANPTAPSPATGEKEVVESASFRVHHRGQRAVAELVARTAEEKRAEIFARWSGPPGGAWETKCEIHLHDSAEAFAAATKQHADATGHALVTLDAGRPVGRRIDLRADDTTVSQDALPRELTHVIVADLFPNQPPPRWAIEGMAVLATSSGEVDRYLRTAMKCYRAGELIQLSSLMTLTEPPAERITGYFVGSASLVEFLVRWKGDKAFTTFLRDSQRYGMGPALKRQYGVNDTKELEAVWIRGALTQARGQAE